MLDERRTKNNDPSYLGKKYGRLTVIGFREIPNGKFHAVGWDCKCDCGNVVYGRKPFMVRSGAVRSCGCLKKEQDIHNLGEKRRTHGQSNTRLYGIWEKMRQRCNSENNPAYSNYGGRGIKVCAEWDSDFSNFYEWAMSNGYTDELSIERVDVNGGYNPDNCCWIPLPEQAKNKRNIRYVTINGEKMPLKTACEMLGMPYKAVHLRITRRGMSAEEALKKPILDPNNTISRKCKDRGMPYRAVMARVYQMGWSLEKALNTPIDTKKGRSFGVVIQYDLSGNEIARYDSAYKAEKETGIKNIERCISGDYKQAGGYLWKRIANND